jgi:hypothetical protein
LGVTTEEIERNRGARLGAGIAASRRAPPREARDPAAPREAHEHRESRVYGDFVLKRQAPSAELENEVAQLPKELARAQEGDLHGSAIGGKR